MRKNGKVKVERYRRRRDMERGMARRLAEGFRVEGQIGKLDPALKLFKTNQVTVTYVRDESSGSFGA